MKPEARKMDAQTHDYAGLLIIAEEAAEYAYVPYSHFKVGAALLTAGGKIYTGCNVENSSYSATICAERTAAVKAVSEGHTDFAAIAIACGEDKPVFPCGVCRQFLSEFSKDMKIVIGSTSKGLLEIYGIGELLPHAFSL
jgi:cytidine deaminase